MRFSSCKEKLLSIYFFAATKGLQNKVYLGQQCIDQIFLSLSCSLIATKKLSPILSKKKKCVQNFKKNRISSIHVATKPYLQERQSNKRNNTVCYIKKLKNFTLKLCIPTTLKRPNLVKKVLGEPLISAPIIIAQVQNILY